MTKTALLAGIALTGFAFSASADEPTTLENVVSHGVTMNVQGLPIPVVYHDDGTYSANAMGSDIPGTWRIEGHSLCTESSMQPGESCTEYPDGKGPGDTFNVNSASLGAVTVTINE
ncbi:hypothetical protein [Ponticaulis sp.]|uniref:hypothetical protein n=1 Tax=Ponticaulis sp. TaxID=2020902 RepID=UPI000B73147E|nr:hypothetical protein [Ponticaulis sp.]MAI89320.1 hypothetical protein [Ponticaulis sp.]OUY01300.1 MAG: hypothetical protein CBB65_02395 [Hyphomonadaceae bacterium TMED5]|tara:strand:+ start:51180 stop:51527 length:348 start_codon:yes stop_codon:yes gene_type:complete